MDRTWIKKWDNKESYEEKVLTKEEIKMYSQILIKKEEDYKIKDKKIADSMYEGLIEDKN